MKHDEKGIRSTTCRLLIAFMVAGWLLLVPTYGHSAGNKQPDAPPAPPDSQSANSPGTAKTGAVATNDKDDYQGDKVSFAVTLTGKMLSKNCSKATIPAGITLVGQGRELDPDDTSKINYLFVIKCKHGKWYQIGSTPIAPTITNCDDYKLEDKDVVKNDTCVGICTCDGKSLWGGDKVNKFKEGEIISIPAATLDKFKPNRYGLAYGLLAVPFKFELTGKKEVKGSATLGPYVGYRWDREGTAGYAISGVIFAGAANVSGSKTTSNPATMTGGTTTTKTSDTNLFAFSYGVGLLGVIKDGFQIGAVLGFDHAESGQGFKYNDKPWLAFQIGYEFSLPQ